MYSCYSLSSHTDIQLEHQKEREAELFHTNKICSCCNVTYVQVPAGIILNADYRNIYWTP